MPDNTQKLLNAAMRSYAKTQANVSTAEAVKVEQRAERKSKQQNPRSRYFAFILYPDNAAQMDWLEYLKAHDDIVYILHEAECGKVAPNNLLTMAGNDEPPHDFKNHYHVMIRFRNPHYLTGFVKSSCGAISHAEAVKDVYSYAKYMIHDTYEALKAHKKEYTAADVQFSNSDFWCYLYCASNDESNLNSFQQLAHIAQYCCSYQELCFNVASLGRGDLLRYIESHSYHVKLCFFDIKHGKE